MDEIEYKLKSQDPTLISHAISKLVQIIIEKSKLEKDIAKISEFQILTLKCKSDDSVVSTSACQALIIFVEAGLYTSKSAIATFLSVCSSTNYESITVAVSELLMLDYKMHNQPSEYNLEASTQHPFITILNQEKYSWRAVLIQMKQIMHHNDNELVELLRPVFLYILCNPSTDLDDGFKQQAWQLVIETSDASNLKVEILLWLCVNQTHICIDMNCRVLELAERSLLKKDIKYCTALVPLITSLTINFLEYGYHPAQNLSMILDLIEQCCDDYIGDIMIILMAEIILICPATYLSKVFNICRVIMDKMPCNVILLHALAAALLKWLAYPSMLCQDLLPVAKELINRILQQKDTDSYHVGDNTVPNELLLTLSHSNNHIRIYTELVRNLYSLESDVESWLENFALAPVDLGYMCKLILCGIFLHSSEFRVVQKSCQILVKMVHEINSFASHMLSLLLHKLTKTNDSVTSKYLLLSLPEFVVYKENLRIVIHTLNSLLSSDKSLQYFAVQLYVMTLKKEPRCQRFVSDALIDLAKESGHSWHSDVACARAIKYVCESRPELCTDFVPLLSQILNRCYDLNGGAASALALDSISLLCEAAIIGVCSTWKLLAPKMRKEKRTVILESLCGLFTDVPSFPFKSDDDYESFFVDVVPLLWSYVVGRDMRVAESALKALKSYSFARIPLNALPLEFRSNVTLPRVYYEKAASKDVNPEDIVQYVPGACWIQMLKNINRSILTMAGDLLISYIEEELGTYKSQIYNWPQGEPCNFKYLPERSVIRAVGEHLRRSNPSDPSEQRIVVECMRIFTHKYTKPLPNVQWEFLSKAMQISEVAKEYGLSIASRHSYISSSAKLLVENCLSKYRSPNFKSTSDVGMLLLNEKHLVFYTNLHELCQAFPPNDLKHFLEASLDCVVEKISLNDEKAVASFDRIMSSYATVLNSDATHLGNRTLLYTILKNIFQNIDLTSNHFHKYFTTVMELSVEEVERVTSPNIWWEGTPEKLRNAIVVRVELASRKFSEMPLSLLNEPIDVVASSSTEMQKYLLEGMQKVLAELRSEKYCVDWIVEFMSRINTLMLESPDEKDKIAFYCDILFISVICLSGMDCLLSKKELLSASQDFRIRLFPQAILMLVNKQIWKSTTRQVFILFTLRLLFN
ncbi:focadhesin-like [Odontomachus brunneus]|uniref:focadhesin-like n=1 Tax=Odontomachus brunneus TaxID=486640 RepID=UPI0013F1EB5B|nr:focadhesin-like [Odontomachus brunneus]XP_032674487.1 focadhesin-like [Odontomachus brunneus]XP_032674489.1 focadhesin-like [Odontomachus brunneus]